ncbi:LysR substrate-binding domain-containing protein, partial [Microbacterium jejuense]
GKGRGRDAASRRPGGRPAGAGKGTPKGSQPRKAKPAQPRSPQPEPVTPVMPARFTLGAIPGATPGRWIDTWNDRMPHTALELVPLAVADQRRALVDDEVDAALVRLPIEKDGLHVIPLYDEVPVVVTSKDSHLLAVDELDTADLVGEVLVVPRDDVLGIRIPGTVEPRFAPPADTAEAIATVAAGVGFVVVPMSLARLHHRKDADYRPLHDGPTSTVALAWVAERANPAVDAFVGIVRGRTANSSRG